MVFLYQVFSLFKRNKIDRAKLAKAIAQLKIMENKLKLIESKIENSIEEKTSELLKYNAIYGSSMAKVIAAEIADQKKVLLSIRNMRMGVEKVRMRFETVMDVGGSVEMLKEVFPLVNDLKKSVNKAVPELAIMFNDFEEKLNEVSAEIDSSSVLGSPLPNVSEPSNSEVDAILKEAQELARAREKNRLPSPP